jgi:hypothetical protein
MLKIKLPKIFKRKEKTPLEIELKKYPRKRRARLRELYEQYEQGKILKIEK